MWGVQQGPSVQTPFYELYRGLPRTLGGGVMSVSTGPIQTNKQKALEKCKEKSTWPNR